MYRYIRVSVHIRFYYLIQEGEEEIRERRKIHAGVLRLCTSPYERHALETSMLFNNVISLAETTVSLCY